ncbi:Glycerophosphocholine phosphodiesterase [Gaertneriomyces sp. JEL0708]|nr:Glycerophosphocholine phosphodiesterase [Gaertneriomyces sp. JEL0708]
MKFGRTLLKYQVPEWSKHYIGYKSLKRLIKQAKRAKDEKGPDSNEVQDAISAFVRQLEAEAKKVNAFWTSHKSAIEKRLRLIADQMNQKTVRKSAPDELVEAMNEIRIQLYLILRYLEMNITGFRKILKKFDKKLDQSRSEQLNAEKIASLPFATDTSLEKILIVVDDLTGKAQSLQSTPGDTPSVHVSAGDLEPSADIERALNKDDVDLLKAAVTSAIAGSTPDAAEEDTRTLLASALVRACYKHAKHCLAYLLGQCDVISLPLPADVNNRTLLHRLAIMGAALQNGKPSVTSPFAKDDPALVEFILNQIPQQTVVSALRARDFLGRTPIHYVALYGLPRIAKVLLDHLPEGRSVLDDAWLDEDGHSPLFYAVVKGYVDVLLLLLSKWELEGSIGEAANREGSMIAQSSSRSSSPNRRGSISPNEAVNAVHTLLLPASHTMTAFMESNAAPSRATTHSLLALASTYGYEQITRVLLENKLDPNVANDDGETPLHIAARGGHAACIRLLVGACENANWIKAKIDAKDRAFGRTPLFLAAMEGHLDSVKILIEAGASVELQDAARLNPHEYAVFRAHNEVAALLRPRISGYPPKPEHTGLSSVAQAGMVERAFGHRYLKGKYMIRVYLGTLDLRRQAPPVQFDEKRIPAQIVPGTFKLTVSAKNAIGEPAVYELPIFETVPDPIIFYTDNFQTASLQFDIHPAYGDAEKKARLVGRASALLSTVKTSLWQERTPLGGNVIVPIMSTNTFDIIGQVMFEFVVVTPFAHQNFKGEGNRLWKSNAMKVVGHRGLGMNKAAHVADGRGHLQLGENTLLSFITAGALGAEYVEFDVQLTKDLVPVLYHDFTVWETGYRIPMSSLTLAEFLALRPKEKPAKQIRKAHKLNRRTMSMSDSDEAIHMMAVAGATSPTASAWPVHGNAEGSIQLPFTTLEEALKTVPSKIGFNVEVKYPNLQEAEKGEMHSNAEINVFCDRILEAIFDHAGDRNIYFSSFHPEICWMLSMKQNQYPVFFLTEGGTETTYDARCNSLLNAVRFATRAGCLGIVTKVDPILEAPGLIKAIRESGLLLFTYGAMNNEVANAKLQRDYGVDAIIVDKVKRVFSEVGTRLDEHS